MFRRSELQIPDPLPCPRRQPPVGNRDRYARAYQCALDMCRHIITPLSIMPIQATLLILRHNAIERITHIGAHILIPVLVEAERAARVLDEERQEPDLVVFELGELLDDRVRYQVRASAARGERKCFLGPCCSRHDVVSRNADIGASADDGGGVALRGMMRKREVVR